MICASAKFFLLRLNHLWYSYYKSMWPAPTTMILVSTSMRASQNPYDPQAIAVHGLEGEKLGYIPREINAPLVALMDQGEKLVAYIVHRYHREGQAEQFVIRIYHHGRQD